MNTKDKEMIDFLYNGCRVSRCGVVASALVCNIIVNEFELQSCYYIHFEKYTILLISPPPSYALNSITCILLQG